MQAASHHRHLSSQQRQGQADSRDLLDVVIALCPVIVNHGLDSLQRELSRQRAVVRGR